MHAPEKPREVDLNAIPDEIAESIGKCGGIQGLYRQLPAEKILRVQSARHRASADPVRLKILILLSFQPLCVCVLKEVLRIADSKLSYHLQVLRKAGLIDGVQQGNWIIYRLTPDGQEFCRTCMGISG